ncbi:MAG: hypothetical protein CMD31_02970 [Flavobacteriales bacterium]|nr:hypothetical protein [Flavobacteriales bacterium]|tara:strand:+ start:36109 stop:36402 length:294 start_codon:yes stop_codon:yes gene_type:complete
MKTTFNSSYDKVFKACISALDKLNMSVEYFNKNSGIIEASTKATFLSWGEDIKIHIIREGGRTVVKVKSDASAQLISWGKDSKNENDIIDALKKKLN